MLTKTNSIDDILESKFRGSVDRNVYRFNLISEDEWEEEYKDLYEYIVGHEYDR